MSVESQLKQEFNRYKQHTTMPEPLEQRLAAGFEQFHQPQQREITVGRYVYAGQRGSPWYSAD